MKVKFEIEMPESAHKIFRESFDDYVNPIELDKFLRGRKAFVRSITQRKNPIYSIRNEPVGVNTGETVVELFVQG